MKNRMLHWSMGVILGALPLAAGCAPAATSAGAEPPVVVGITNTNAAAISNEAAEAAEAAEVAEPGAFVDEDIEELPEGVDPAEAEATPVTTGVTVPQDLGLARPALEVVKLVNSGMDESVLMAYATNSASTFNLSADQIIYLKDIGVPAGVITAMIQRDQVLKDSGAAVAEAQAVVTNEMAQAGPPPEEVAPQPDGTATNVVTAPPEGSVSYNTFYDSLSPYGTWVNVDGYGLCWQPSVVAVNPYWQPYYNDGRWVYSDCGWYWYSNYSWGWAPFHYGRWFRHSRIGWCWRPGYVWGPSWVTWRYNDAYCGWAPLPPAAYYRPGFGFSYYGRSVAVNFSWGLSSSCYSFVPVKHFRSHRLHHYGLPHHQVNNIYNNTVVATKIVNNKNVIVNQGIPPSKVARATGSQVPRMSVRPVTVPVNDGTRGERLAANNKSLIVYRPDVLKNSSSGSRLTQRPSNPYLASPKASAQPVAQSTRSGAPAVAKRTTDPVPVVRAPQAPGESRLVNRPASSRVASSTPQRVAPTTPAASVRPETKAAVTPTAPKAANPFLAADSTRPVNRFNTRPQTPSTPAVNAAPSRSGSSTSTPRTAAPLILRGPSPVPYGGTTPAAPATPSTPTVRPSVPNSNPFVRTPTPQQVAPTPRQSFTPAPSVNSGSRLTQRPQTMQTPAATPTPAPQNRFIAPSTPAYSRPAAPQTPAYSRPAVPQTPARSAPATPRVSTPSFRSQPSYTPPPASQPRMSTPAPRMSAPATPSFRPSTPSYAPQARSFTPSTPSRSFAAPPASSRSFAPSASSRSSMAMPAPSSGSRLSNRGAAGGRR